MLEALLALQAHVQEHGQPPVTVYGICWNVDYLAELEAVYSELKYAFQELQLDPHEPILSYNYHKDRGTLWVGEQRELRLDLIQKLITYYQEQEDGLVFSYNNFTKREQVADLVSRHHLTDHAVVGNTLYGVYRFGLYDCGIVVYLLANSRNGYGYKTIGEECFPNEVSCPERILRQSTLPDNGWRKACRDNRKQVFKLQDGLSVRFTAAVLPREFKGLRDFVVRRIQTAYGRPYWTFIAVQDATVRYKLTNKQQHLYGLEVVV